MCKKSPSPVTPIVVPSVTPPYSAEEGNLPKHAEWGKKLKSLMDQMTDYMQKMEDGLVNKDSYAAGEKIYVECYENFKEILGPNHPGTIRALGALGGFYLKHGKDELAGPLISRTLEKCKIVYGVDDPTTMISMRNLAFLYKEQGKHTKADMLVRDFQKHNIIDSEEAKHLEHLKTSIASLGEHHPRIAGAFWPLARYYYSKDKYAAAETLYLDISEFMKTQPTDDLTNLGKYIVQDRITSCRQQMAAEST